MTSEKLNVRYRTQTSDSGASVSDDSTSNSYFAHRPSVFFFVPNLIGYARLFALFLSWASHAADRPSFCLALYLVSAALDFFDGFFARLLGQVSVFGAWFDVFIDVLGRTTMWAMVSSRMGFPWGQLVASVEWAAFLCIHANHGSRWKENLTTTTTTTEEEAAVAERDRLRTSTFSLADSSRRVPRWVSRCFVNGFKSPWGVLVISGVHALPPWLYAYVAWRQDVDAVLWWIFAAPLSLNWVALPVLVAGRIYAGLVEAWIVYDHVRFLSKMKE